MVSQQDRGRAGRLSRPARRHGRGDLPCRLRLAPGAGAAGLRASDDPPRPGPAASPRRSRSSSEQIEELRARMGEGGLREAFIRAIIYIRLPELAADERSFTMLQQAARRVRQGHDPGRFQGAGPRPVHDGPARPGAGGGQPARAPWPAARPTRPRRSSCCARCWRSVGRCSRSPGSGWTRWRRSSARASSAAPAAEPKPKRRLSVAGGNDAAS